MTNPLSDRDRRRLEDLFARAAGLPEAEQPGFALSACGANLPLCAELLRLLAAHAGEDHLQRLRAGDSGRPDDPPTDGRVEDGHTGESGHDGDATA